MAVETALSQAKLTAHPVGSYYFSAEATDPSILFGGEWLRIKDRFILAAGDTYVGALVTKLAEGAPMREAMIFASKASSITVTRRGAQQSIPYRNEVDTL